MNYIKVRSLDTNKIGILENCRPSAVRLRFVRKLTARDRKILEKNRRESRRAYQACKKKIKEQGLDMHLLKAYVPLNSKKIFFYYTAEERVDFRKLVRELARIFRKRIEMRQVGVRDAVQILGWAGLCGDIPCCIKFIENFDSISLRDIEEQNLPLSPSKFTGPCGRLVCCMSFEKENYLVKILFPPKGSELCLGGDTVKLLEVNPLSNTVVVEMEDRKRELPLEQLLPKGYERVLEFYRNCGGCARRFVTEDAADHEATAHS